MIFCQLWCPFCIDFVTFWRSGATVKTVLSPVRESYFHSLSVCKEVFFDSTLSVPALGDIFCIFWTILGSMWVPGETILAPRGFFLNFGTMILKCFLMQNCSIFGHFGEPCQND